MFNRLLSISMLLLTTACDLEPGADERSAQAFPGGEDGELAVDLDEDALVGFEAVLDELAAASDPAATCYNPDLGNGGFESFDYTKMISNAYLQAFICQAGCTGIPEWSFAGKVTAYLVGSPGPYALILADTDVAAGAGHEAVMFNDAAVSPNQNYSLRFKAASGGSTSSKLRVTVSKFADAAGTIPGGPSQTQDFTIASPSSGQITLPFSTGPSDVRVRVRFVRDRIYTDKSMLSLDDVAITCN